MKFSLILLVVLCAVFVAVDSTSRLRYVNSMPQFGSSTVKAYLPITNLFTSVPGEFLTNYINITNKPWIFTASYPTNISALSNPYLLSNNQFYSLYTYQTANSHLMNALVSDKTSFPNTTMAYLRTINLLQHNFNLDVFNLSNNVQIFDNTTYGVPTDYVPVPPGDYIVYWTSATSKRNLEHGGNRSGDPFLFGGKAYTYWILPTGSFIIQDGVITTKRSVAEKRTIQSKREMKQQNQMKSKEDGSAVVKNADNKNNDANLGSDEKGNKGSIGNGAQKAFVQSR